MCETHCPRELVVVLSLGLGLLNIIIYIYTHRYTHYTYLSLSLYIYIYIYIYTHSAHDLHHAIALLSCHTSLSASHAQAEPLGPLGPRLEPTHYTILYYTILYYTILYYTILYYTIVASHNILLHPMAATASSHWHLQW